MSNGSFKSDAFESIHKSVEGLHRTGVIDEANFYEKIAAGMASLRAGKCIDGEAFMAKLDVDLAAKGTRDQ